MVTITAIPGGGGGRDGNEFCVVRPKETLVG
jgi:hypothetical protein